MTKKACIGSVYLSRMSAIVQANRRSPSGNCNATIIENKTKKVALTKKAYLFIQVA